MLVRKATYDDALDILEWRNDPVTRSMFRTPELVTCDQHLAWFAKAIDDPKRLILVSVIAGRKIGMVRFDQGNHGWDVSINISPNERQKGCGEQLLRDGIAFLRREVGGDILVTSEIKLTNGPSLRIFERCGFQQVDQHDGYLHMQLSRDS